MVVFSFYTQILINHRGDCFKSTFEMCQTWGIDYYLFAERRKRGWSLQQALLTPICEGSTVFDHEGHIFANEQAMCENWGINHRTYENRRKRGWNLRDALSVQVMKPDDTQRVMHIVEQYEAEDILRAINEFQEKHGAMRKRNRTRRNSSGPIKNPIKDHKGHTFANKKEMCRFWNIDFQVFHNRDNDDWPMCYALTYPKGGPYIFRDHNGNDFRSIAKMCNYYDIDKKTFKSRMDNGWTIKDALTLPTERPIIGKPEMIS